MVIREAVKETLKELIRIPSVSGKEKGVLEYVENRLKSLGIPLKRQEIEKDRYNLVYDNGSEYLISVHVDTVPPAGFRDAYRPKEVNGRIYGRGASDVKGAIASLITAVEWFKKDFPEKELPVSLAFVVDEEQNTALGSENLPKCLNGKRKCIVLEPTYGLVCTKQYGAYEFSVKIKCKSAHGSEFEKVENPVKVFIKLLNKLEEVLKREVNVIMVRSGTKVYTVPKTCEALLEFKVFEGERKEELEKKVQEVVSALNTECEITVKLEGFEEFQEFNTDGLLDVVKKALLKGGRRSKRKG
ncbi:M20 family metallopeptidase [Aquifex aeolicus]|uniref:Succinyl-diaminopimelate desuccinylase n=1 Tax=Aquifex aeolicus (strain VF5) TaxID=224324 RepID=O66823_AQUAE|nr:M20 family metallopeptidase [Aquifex aeolicus]AAC06782.1 succinyl-diaminopimelate desuccinylase [Aquifex aeolicus VF5]